MQSSRFLLPLIVFAQFAGTSLWFAGNAVIDDILPNASTGFANITSIVQFGFIAGTLIFSLLTVADRFPAPGVFFFSSIIAAVTNAVLIFAAGDTALIFSLRFLTGFFLAGIYPVGMKIAADCFPRKLGNALGFLVGALVLGTAFPHLVRSQLHTVNWKTVLLITSILATIGGVLILLVSSYKKTPIQKIDLSVAIKVFQSNNFKGAALGYFGHMWELYTFWAFVPTIIGLYNSLHQSHLNIALWAFIIISIGAAGCITGGILSKRIGSKKVAVYSLSVSGLACLLSPLIFQLSGPLFLASLMVWGFTVVSDSPQFSTLVAQFAPFQNKGTALTFVTSIGFAITIVSIQFLKLVFDSCKEWSFLLLLPGPVFGLIFLYKYNREGYNLSNKK